MLPPPVIMDVKYAYITRPKLRDKWIKPKISRTRNHNLNLSKPKINSGNKPVSKPNMKKSTTIYLRFA
jgi:hypothetical protein